MRWQHVGSGPSLPSLTRAGQLLRLVLALPQLLLLLATLLLSFLFKGIRAAAQLFFGSPLSLLLISPLGDLRPYFQWARQRILTGRLATCESLEEYRRLEAQLQQAPAHPPASALTLHNVTQLRSALRTRNGSAILYLLHSAAAHVTAVKDHEEHHTLTEAMTEALEQVCQQPAAFGVPLPLLRTFLGDLRLYVGRTALCLSGGGSLAMAHVGVLKTLLSQGLLPRVISGTSGGSIVAAIACLSLDAELTSILASPGELVGTRPFCTRLSASGASPPAAPLPQAPPVFFEPLGAQLLHYFTAAAAGTQGSFVSPEVFRDTLHSQFGEATFSSAYARTGRILIISVFSTLAEEGSGGEWGSPLILSYLSAPQVLIYSAVQASCALPGLMMPSVLLARNERGETVPYHPMDASAGAIDGSLFSDLPTEELSLLFFTRRFIVSQTNPHVAMLLAPPRASITPGTPMSRLEHAIIALDESATLRIGVLARSGIFPTSFARVIVPLTTQLYSAGSLSDNLSGATIVPRGPAFTLFNAFRQPTSEEVEEMARCGERATWPLLGYIVGLTALERCISACTQMTGETPQQMQERRVAEELEGGGGGCAAPAPASAALTPLPKEHRPRRGSAGSSSGHRPVSFSLPPLSQPLPLGGPSSDLDPGPLP